MTGWTRRLVAAPLLVAFSAAPSPATPPPPAQEFVQAGIRVRFEIGPAAGEAGGGPGPRAGEPALVRFRISDTSGAALGGLRPAAWLDLRAAGQPPDDKQCRAKIQSFLQSSLGRRATVDLNAYHVLALNDEASISVLDPLRGFGTSRLLTLVRLKGRGEDWALSRDGRRLFVSMPEANQVAAIATDTWKVLADVEAGPKPARLALQPDGRYLWLDNQAIAGGTGGGTVTVVDAAELKAVARIATGAGPHDFAFTPDDRYALVSNREEGTVSVVDVRALAKIKDLPSGARPTAVAFSPLSNAFYAAHEADGAIVAIDAESHQVVARMQAEPGLAAIRFAPGGRWGFAVNRRRDAVHVFDATTNRLRYTVPVQKAPDQIAFTPDFAYLRALESDQVTMIGLAGLGTEAGPSTNEFPAGQRTPARSGAIGSAAAIVAAPEAKAVLVANPADQLIYYYAEGMAAPMGSFNNYRRTPRAVLVADRSLRETGPGEYAASVSLPASGSFDVPFLLDSPRIVHCFEASVEANPAVARSRQAALRVEPLVEEKRVAVGSVVRLRFKATDPETGHPRAGLQDLQVLTVRAPGSWRDGPRAMATVEDGIYQADFSPPRAGVYYVHWRCPSLGLSYSQSSPLVIHVTAEAHSNARP